MTKTEQQLLDGILHNQGRIIALQHILLDAILKTDSPEDIAQIVLSIKHLTVADEDVTDALREGGTGQVPKSLRAGNHAVRQFFLEHLTRPK